MSDVPAASSAAPVTATPSPAPASPSPAPASVAPAAAPEGSVAPAPSSPSEPGPIPYARFKEVNDQLKAAREFQEKHGWVEEFQGNPYPYLDQWLDQVSGHPEMGPKLLAKAARMLQARRGQAPAVAEEPTPDVPIMDAQGNVISQTYSAPQLKKWQEWQWAQREAAFAERLGPLEQMKTALEHQQQEQRVQAQSEQQAKTLLTELRQDPLFTAHEPAIKQALIDHPEWGDNVDRAYRFVLTSTVIPGLSQKEQAKVLDHLQTQANGATVSPHGASPTGPPKFKSFKEASEYYAKHPDEAARMAER